MAESPKGWKTGVIYDERMAEPKCLWDDNYNERPERYTHVLKRCRELGLFERCLTIPPRESTEAELLKLHTPEMISILKATEDSTDVDALEDLSSQYDFLYIHPKSFRLSLLACGSTIELVDSILEGKVKNGMAIVRPPGHHAMKSEYCGYCYFNNVAVAAQHAMDNKNIKRILIVDWDIHHGQATQQLFYEDPRVLYFSIHEYLNGTFWPNLRESDYHNIGRGAGLGYNVNVPMNKIKMENSDYMAIFHQLLLPMAYEFQPELIIVSAGYDAALGCPEGEMEITPACYSHFTSSLMGLASGRVAVVLEGGYCLKSLAEGAALTLRTLLGDPCPLIDPLSAPSRSVQESILSVTYALRKQWKSLQHLATFRAVTKDLTKDTAQFWPQIEFNWTDERAERYQTRGICPTQDPHVFAELDARLDVLIKGTNLEVPQHRLSVVRTWQSDSCWPATDEVHDLTVPAVTASQSIMAMVDSLMSGESRSGIAIVDPSPVNIHAAVEHALNQHALQRILVVDWRTRKDSKLFDDDDPRLLYVSLRAADEEIPGCSRQGFTVNVALSENVMNTINCVAAFARVVLPLAYQFNPQLVIVAADDSFKGDGKMKDFFGHSIHLLSSLAAGRLLSIFEGSESSLLCLREIVSACFQALNGNSISNPEVEQHQLDAGILNGIRSLMKALRPFWNAFQFDVELPQENVLVSPWVTTDVNVLKFNPEIELF